MCLYVCVRVYVYESTFTDICAGNKVLKEQSELSNDPNENRLKINLNKLWHILTYIYLVNTVMARLRRRRVHNFGSCSLSPPSQIESTECGRGSFRTCLLPPRLTIIIITKSIHILPIVMSFLNKLVNTLVNQIDSEKI